ncbi:hypothetical protein GEMRC1_004614 [Eukaryota sp. GEM-RC1]
MDTGTCWPEFLGNQDVPRSVNFSTVDLGLSDSLYYSFAKIGNASSTCNFTDADYVDIDMPYLNSTNTTFDNSTYGNFTDDDYNPNNCTEIIPVVLFACTGISYYAEVCGTEAQPIYQLMPKRVPITGAFEDWTVSDGHIHSSSVVGVNKFTQSGGSVSFAPGADLYIFDDFYLQDSEFFAESHVYTFASGFISGTGNITFTQDVDIFNTIEFTGATSIFNESLTAEVCRFIDGTIYIEKDLHCGMFTFEDSNLFIRHDMYSPHIVVESGTFRVDATMYAATITVYDGHVDVSAVNADNVVVYGGIVTIENGFTCNRIEVYGGLLDTLGPIEAYNITVSGGVWHEHDDVTTQFLQLNGGLITGEADIQIMDLSHWRGGLFNDTGKTFFKGGLTIEGTAEKTHHFRPLIFDSDVNWDNGVIYGDFGAYITIEEDGCLYINTASTLERPAGNSTVGLPHLYNFGCIQKTVPGTAEIQYWTLNNGTITLLPSTEVTAFWGGECNNRFTPAAGSTLQFKRFYQSMNASCLIRGDGKVTFGGSDDALIEMMAESMLDVQEGTEIEFGVTNFLPDAEVRSVGQVLTVYNGIANFAPGSSFVLRAVVSKGGFVYGRGDLFLQEYFLFEGGASLWLSVLATRGNITGGVHTFDGAAHIEDYLNVIGGTAVVGGDLTISKMNTIGGNVNVSGDVSADVLTQIGGTLEGTGIIRAVDLFLWEGGTISGSGILRSDTLMLIQGTEHTLIQRDLQNWNDLYWFSGDIIGRDGARFVNTAAGRFYVMTGKNNCSMIHASGAVPFFLSYGDMYKYNTSYIAIEFKIIHTQFMYVYDGTLALFAGGDYSNVVHVEGGATLELAGGNVTMGFGAHLRVPNGTFEVSGGHVELDYAWYDITDRMLVSGGRVDFYRNTELFNNGREVLIAGGIMFLHRTNTFFGYVNIFGGELHLDAIIDIEDLDMTVPGGRLVVYRFLDILGTADLYAGMFEVIDLCDISGLLTWYGGSIEGVGRLFTDGSFDIYEGPTPKEFRIAEFYNTQEGRWHGGDIFAYDGAVFRNLMGSSFNLIPGGSLFYGGGEMSRLQNLGLVYKSGSGIAQINIYIDQRSLVNITGGHLNVSGGQDSSGIYTVLEGTYLEFGGGTTYLHPGSWVRGAGDVIFSGGTTIVTCQYDISSITYHSGGNSNWDPGLDLIDLGNWLNISGGVMTFHGYPLTVANVYSSGGALHSDSAVEVRDLWIQHEGVHRLDGRFEIFGEVFIYGGDLGGAGRTDTFSPIYWYGGEISGTNILNVPKPFYILGPDDKMLTSRRVETFNETFFMEGDVYGRHGSALIISTVATLHLIPGGDFLFTEEGRVPELGNAGGVMKHHDTYNEIAWYITNIAQVNISMGWLNFGGGGWFEGVIFSDSDTMIEFSNRVATFAPLSILHGVGNLLFSGGITNIMSFAEVILTPVGSMTVDGGEVNVEDDAYLNVRSMIVQGPPTSMLNFLGTSRMDLPSLYVHGGQIRSRARIYIPASFNFTDGLTSWMGELVVEGDGIISGGVHTFVVYSLFHGEFILTGTGVIAGEGRIDMRDVFYFEGGTLSGASPLTSRGGIKIYTPQPKYIDQRLVQNENTLLWEGGHIYMSNLAVINNSKPATFKVAFDEETWSVEHTAGVQSFIDNEGHFFVKSSENSTVEIKLILNNHGLFEIESGEFDTQFQFNSWSEILVHPEGILHMSDGFTYLYFGSINCTGTFLKTGGTTYVQEVHWFIDSKFEIFGGDIIFFSDVMFNVLGRPFLVTGGTVDFRLPPPKTDHWIVQGGLLMYHCNTVNITHLEVSSGTLSGKGRIYAQEYFKFTGGYLIDTGYVYSPLEIIEGSDTKFISQYRIWVTDRLNWSEGDLIIDDGGLVEVNQTGLLTFDLIDDIDISMDFNLRESILLNHGSMNINANNFDLQVNILWNTTSTGSTNLLSGTVNPTFKLFSDPFSFPPH